MFKKILLMAVMAIPALMSAQTVKIGLVNAQEVMKSMPDTEAAQKQLQDVSAKYEEEYRKLNDEMRRMYDELANLDENTLPAIRERKTQDFTAYQQKIQQFEQSAMQDVNKLQDDLMQPIMMKIRNAVEAVGMEGGYSLIQAYDPQLVFYMAAPTVDITNEVKAKLGIK